MMKKIVSVLGVLAFLASGAADAQSITPYAHNNIVTPPNSGFINNVALTANTAATITWPAGSSYVNVNCPSPPYYTSLQSGITVPNATVTNGAGAALNTAQRGRSAGEMTFYIISATAQTCSLEYWSN